jgi:hypothetical protein
VNVAVSHPSFAPTWCEKESMYSLWGGFFADPDVHFQQERPLIRKGFLELGT